MMEYSGLIPKFKINRPLTDEERAEQLHQKNSMKDAPFYGLSAIKINSTFFESVDKYYSSKGIMTLFLMPIILLLTFLGWMLLNVILLSSKKDIHPPSGGEMIFITILLLVVLIFLIGSIWLLSRECFAYTHWPIRLNRKNRMVYVFRKNKAGGVLIAPWDKIFFHYGKGAKQTLQHWDLRGHILSEDGNTVLDTFAFSVESVDKEDLDRHWEFLRRYMEQPIEKFVPSLAPPVEVCLPIADRKEPYIFGLKRLLLNFNGHPIAQTILFPLFFIFSLGRLIAMRTSKIPRWPDEVEAACAIDPNDPYRRDASMNPPGTIHGWR